MEPNYPNPTLTNLSGGQPAPTPGPKKRWPLSGKITAVAAAVLLVVIGGIVALSLGKGGGGKSAQRDSSLYIDRDGFARSESIGDPKALAATAGKVVQYEGQATVQPCGVVTIKDLDDAKLQLETGLDSAVTTAHFDGEGKGKMPFRDGVSFPLFDEDNYCYYTLNNKEHIVINIYQPTYVGESPFKFQQSGFTKVSDIEGLTVYKQKSTDAKKEEVYFIRGNKVDMRLYLTIADEAARNKVLAAAAKRLAAIPGTPTPVEAFGYKSPVFTGDVLQSCDLIDNTMFKGLFGVDAGPLVLESFAPSIYATKIDKDSNANIYNHATYACNRFLDDSKVKKSVSMDAKTYETADVAKGVFARTRDNTTLTKEHAPTTPVIGDESYVANTLGKDGVVVFRKGRVIVEATFYLQGLNDVFTKEKRAEVLAPFLKTAVDTKLKGF